MRGPIKIVIVFLLPLLGGCFATETSLFLRLSAHRTGIDFVNRLNEKDTLYNALDFDYVYNGGGVAIGDVNNDGLPDLYFTGNMVSSRLYLNRSDFRFQDVTTASGVETNRWATGVSMVDINGDGWLDIYVCVGGPTEERENMFFINEGLDEEGIPRFVDRAREMGLADNGYSIQAAFFDFDRDDDLDVYMLTNALEFSLRNAVRPKLVRGEGGSTDRLYRNEGDGTFSDISREAGILIEGYGLGVAVCDINLDGWPDVYTSNDFMPNDLLYVNNKDGTFTDRAPVYLRHQTHNGMGMDIADVNNDLLPDIYVLDMLPSDNERQKMMLAARDYDLIQMLERFGYRPQYIRNTLQLHNGIGLDGEPTFSEIAQLAGIHQTDWSWTALFVDLDNDGARDLYVTNGYRRDVTDLDFLFEGEQIAEMGPEEENRKLLLEATQKLPPVKLPNYAFKNNGDLTFADHAKDWGLADNSFSNGAAFADLDLDGDLDLVVNNLDQEAFVYRNNARSLTQHHYLRVKLMGSGLNPGGFGAKLILWHNGRKQYYDHSPYRGYQSTVEPIVHFGLGNDVIVDSMKVTWLDGTVEIFRKVQVDQIVTVRQEDAKPSEPYRLKQDDIADKHLFKTYTPASGLDIQHYEFDIVEFRRTPLLPHRLSKGGPGLAVGDIDHNGLDDLYIGGDNYTSGALLVQVAKGVFERRKLPESDQFEDTGVLFFDADGDGDLDLYVASGGTLAPEGDSLYQDRLYQNDGQGNFRMVPAALPLLRESSSVVTAADFDLDGDLDLFVGGRTIPARYPLSPRSYLLRNDSRGSDRIHFTDLTEIAAPDFHQMGMVLGALWTDFDNDDHTDLIVVGEWMPIRFFHNEDGRLIDVTAKTALSHTEGWWNSITGGDFDSDGDVDYIVGNLGLNNKYKVSPDQPVRIYAKDFDRNGRLDPVTTRYLDGKEYSDASLSFLIEQIPGMRGRFETFQSFSKTTFDRVFTKEELVDAYMARSCRFASSYVENLGAGQFAMRELPLEAQFSPLYGLLSADYDNDGNLDVLAVGNSYAPEPQTGWYDALNGIVLLGDGSGGFKPVPSTQSGFFVPGDGKALVELVIDGQHTLILASQNNDSLKVFSHVLTGGTRFSKLQPLDRYALISRNDGKTQRQEFYYGSGYLSQSSRFLRLPGYSRSVVIYGTGSKRHIALEPPL